MNTSKLGQRVVSAFRAGFDREVPATLMLAFRCFFAFHIFFNTLKLHWRYESGWVIYAVPAVMLLAALLACHRRYYRPGLAVLFLYKAFWIVFSFPLAGNHLYAEALVLLLLILFPDRRLDKEGGARSEAWACHLIQVTILSIYFFAGLQKVAHGMWLNGEYPAESLLIPAGFGWWHSVQLAVTFIGSLIGSSVGPLPLDRPQGFDAVPLVLPAWCMAFCLVTGWAVVLSELAAPLLTIIRRTRRLGLIAMLVLQVGIGLVSWETEFMFAAVGAILLFFHRRPVRNYGILLLIHALWMVGILLADVRVWVL